MLTKETLFKILKYSIKKF